MTLREKLLLTCRAYCSATELSLARVSTLILRSGHRLQSLAEGADVNTRTYESAMQWLSDHWPEGTDWPDGVERPLPSVSGAENSAARNGALPAKGPDGPSASVAVSPGENSPAANAGLRPNGSDARPRFPAAPGGPEAVE